MTKDEFFQKACIAIAGNAGFAEGEDDMHTIIENIIGAAEELTSIASVTCGFDENSINDELTDIRKSISSIDDRGLLVIRSNEDL